MRCETEDTSHTVSVPAFQRRHGTISRHTVAGIDVMDQDKINFTWASARKDIVSHSKGRFTHTMPCPCRPHAAPLPCRAAKGLECVFPIWFTQCGCVWFTLTMPCPCRAHAMLWPCRSSQDHGTARPSRNGLWATCPCLASSGYDVEFHEDCYQKHTNPPHNNPYLRL